LTLPQVWNLREGSHQRVNLPVGGLDLPLVEFFVGGDGGGG